MDDVLIKADALRDILNLNVLVGSVNGGVLRLAQVDGREAQERGSLHFFCPDPGGSSLLPAKIVVNETLVESMALS